VCVCVCVGGGELLKCAVSASSEVGIHIVAVSGDMQHNFH
jgi:hypothetical protein